MTAGDFSGDAIGLSCDPTIREHIEKPPATRAEVPTRLPEMTKAAWHISNHAMEIRDRVMQMSPVADPSDLYNAVADLATCISQLAVEVGCASSDTQHEAGNSDFDAVEAEEAFQDYIAANRLNRTHEAERDE